jgi:proteasome lid subunit RPN8/RPN11
MRITRTQHTTLIELAKAALPHEACGLLAGKADSVLEVLPLANVEHNPVGCGWRADSREQLRAFERIEDQGWELLAIYHSHPRSVAMPSERDIEYALYPDARYVIVSLVDAASPAVASFRIANGQASEEPLTVLDGADVASQARGSGATT